MPVIPVNTQKLQKRWHNKKATCDSVVILNATHSDYDYEVLCLSTAQKWNLY